MNAFLNSTLVGNKVWIHLNTQLFILISIDQLPEQPKSGTIFGDNKLFSYGDNISSLAWPVEVT